MFWSSTILRDLVQSLAKVKLLLKNSVKLRHCILCGDILKDCSKGEPSTTHIAVYITVLSGVVSTQTIQPVCREQFCFLEPQV